LDEVYIYIYNYCLLLLYTYYIIVDYIMLIFSHGVRTNSFGQEFLSHNLHAIVHLSDDYDQFGPLDYCSCVFENFMEFKKKMARSKANLLLMNNLKYFKCNHQSIA